MLEKVLILKLWHNNTQPDIEGEWDRLAFMHFKPILSGHLTTSTPTKGGKSDGWESQLLH